MMIPAWLPDFDEPYAGLAQPARHQALARKGAIEPRLDALAIEHMLRLFR